MKRILLTLCFVFVFAACAWCAEPVNVAPLVNFDKFFEEIDLWFNDILKEGWLLFVSLFFAWMIFYYLMELLYDREEKKEKHKEESDCQEYVSFVKPESKQGLKVECIDVSVVERNTKWDWDNDSEVINDCKYRDGY